MSPSNKRPSRDLLIEFQNTMRRFVETEGRVMQIYLDRADRSRGESTVGDSAASAPAAAPSPGAWPLLEEDGIRVGDDGVETLHTLAPARDRLLDNHRLDGQPVLPAAEAMELMAELAKRGWPALELVEVRDVRVLRGLVVDAASKTVRIAARPAPQAPAHGSAVVLQASITDATDRRMPLYSATLVLGSEPPAAPAYRETYTTRPGPFPTTVQEAYEKYMVHGPGLRTIRRIDGVGEEGVMATVTPSVAGEILAWRPSGEWILDPVSVDTAFQLGWMWARFVHGALPYPYYFGTCRRYHPLGTSDVQCFLHLRVDRPAAVMHSRLFFVGGQGEVLCSFEGIESALKPL